MKLKIKYHDLETQPKIYMNDEGKIVEIDLEAPFILVEKSKLGSNEERTYDVRVGMTKPCYQCGEEKTVDHYHKHKHSMTGTQRICRLCALENHKKAKEERERKEHDENE